MIYNIAYFMGGGVTLEHLEKMVIPKVFRLYNRCLKTKQQIDRQKK